MTELTNRPRRRIDVKDFHLIMKIGERAEKELGPLGMSLDMYRAGVANLVVCHGSYCPMNLEFMLAADLPNFSHDFCEIAKKGGTTGFIDFFEPRMSADNNPRTPNLLTEDQQDDKAHIIEWVGKTYQINFLECSGVAQDAFEERFKEQLQ